jgi:hypothetical protein
MWEYHISPLFLWRHLYRGWIQPGTKKYFPHTRRFSSWHLEKFLTPHLSHLIFLILSFLSLSISILTRDGNGYPKPEYPTGFTR